MKGPLLLILVCAFTAPLFPCTTFQIQGKSSVAVGHNFETYIQNFPGSLFYNPSGEGKTSFTIEGDLIPQPAAWPEWNRISWTSRYRSLTYNVMGKNLPDGGINDQGLYVGEMSLTSSSQDREPGRTYFFPPLFIQYCLDNFASTREVLEALKSVRPTVSYGFYWQYFITDASGAAAVVSFVQKEMVVNTGPDLPHPILCNYPYRQELNNLKKYQGFGGFYKIGTELSPGSIYTQKSSGERFIRIASQLQNDSSTLEESPLLDRVFEILEGVTFDITQWRIAAIPASGRLVLEDRNNRRRWDLRINDFSPQGDTRFISLEKGSAPREPVVPTTEDLRRLVYKTVSTLTLVEFYRLYLTERILQFTNTSTETPFQG